MRAALFQRKSRSGWLEELDGIREDALDAPEGGVGEVADADDIWTDLRDGGEYADPHEISSLYADDETPDRPVSKPPAKASKSAAKGRGKSRPAPEPEVAPAAVEVPQIDTDDIWTSTQEAPAAHAAQYDDQIWVQPAPHPIRPSEMWHPAELAPAPLGQESFGARPEERVASSELQDQAIRERFSPTAAAPAASAPSDAPAPPVQSFVEELAAAEADARSAEPVVPAASTDTWVDAAAEVLESAPVAEPEPVVEPAPVAAVLESELVAAADVALVDGDRSVDEELAASTGLVAGPVPRRVRRDRPDQRQRASLPTTIAPSGVATDDVDHLAPGYGPDGEFMPGGIAPQAHRGDRSPLPTQPLPPAALPTRSNRLPSLDSLPATPSSVVPPTPVSPFEHPPVAAALVGSAAPVGTEPGSETPVADSEPLFDPAGLVIEEPPLETVATEPHDVDPTPVVDAATVAEVAPIVEAAPIVQAAPIAEVAPIADVATPAATVSVPGPATTSLGIAADGMVAVPGTLVRVGGERQATVTVDDEGALVYLRTGWCWASPGDGAAQPLRIDVPNGRLTVASGATALAVVEADGSVFIIVAAGTADLRRGADGVTIERGTIVMIDPVGAAQTDRATDAEIESDPIVAENLALDAEL